ncbi:hypothetical protein Droror1_Dr00005278 [Drosera rotundifolia]
MRRIPSPTTTMKKKSTMTRMKKRRKTTSRRFPSPRSTQSQSKSNHLGVNLSESGRNGDVAGYGGGGKHLARAGTAGAAIDDSPSPGGG